MTSPAATTGRLRSASEGSAGGRARAAEGVSGGGARRRQDLRDAEPGAAAQARGHRCRHRRGRDPWPRRDRPSDKSFEKIAKKRTAYKGHVLAEMDLDAILQRKPQLVLVDELAHTNVDGSRHAKRYLDVEELLAAGIDVYTTLNVQHLESSERRRWRRSPACACWRRCRIPSSTAPTKSSWST